jgi:hypothetical protein
MAAILMTKVKNAIKKELGDGIIFNLHNNSVNGVRRGCSGFATNPANGITVYIETEPSCFDKSMYYRFAKDNKDFSGCRNRTVYDFESLIGGICECLNMPEAYQRELVSWKKVTA